MKSSSDRSGAARRWAAAPLLLAAVLAACGTTPPPRSPTADAAPVGDTAVRSSAEVAPPWIADPLSWSKLDAIEDWLASQPSTPRGFWVLEGELQLQSGRIDLARREAEPPKAAGSAGSDARGAREARLKTAKAALERLLAEGALSAGQQKRARDAAARADQMLARAGQPVEGGPVALIPRRAWGAMPARADRMDKNVGGWRRITIHHSAEREPPDLDGTQSASAAAVRSIQKAHVDGRETGWGDIGYHFVVDPYGRVFQGRELAWQGAHAKGAANVQNIGICLIGNFENEKPTRQALAALQELLDQLRRQHSIPRDEVLAHCDLKRTSCPGKHLEPFVRGYANGPDAAAKPAAKSAKPAPAKPVAQARPR